MSLSYYRMIIKIKCANKNGYSFYKYNWLVSRNIELISAGNKVQNIYMCKKDEYKDFMDSKI